MLIRITAVMDFSFTTYKVNLSSIRLFLFDIKYNKKCFFIPNSIAVYFIALEQQTQSYWVGAAQGIILLNLLAWSLFNISTENTQVSGQADYCKWSAA